MNTETAFLLTGGTGFLGRRLLRRLLEDQCKVITLCRGGRNADGGTLNARSRMLTLIDELGCASLGEQVFVIDADLADLDPAALTLGIREGLRQLGATQLVAINVAASLKMDYEGQAEAKREATRTLNFRTNVQGVERLLQALDGVEASTADAKPVIAGLVQFSTCYAHGRREGLLPEEAVDPAFGTENSYEQTKRVGEALVARWQAQRANPVPVSIVRPSIVTGPDTRDGYLAWLDIMAEPVSLERLSGWKRWLIGIEAPQARLMELVGAVVRRLRIPIVPMLGNGGGILDLIDASDVEKYSWLVVQRHRAGLTPGLRYLHISNPQAPSLREAWALTVSAFGQQDVAR